MGKHTFFTEAVIIVSYFKMHKLIASTHRVERSPSDFLLIKEKTYHSICLSVPKAFFGKRDDVTFGPFFMAFDLLLLLLLIVTPNLGVDKSSRVCV